MMFLFLINKELIDMILASKTFCKCVFTLLSLSIAFEGTDIVLFILENYDKNLKPANSLICFLCLMIYQPLWLIWCQTILVKQQ